MKIHPSNYNWLLSKGYGPFSVGDIIIVSVNDLSVGSSSKIEVSCVICSKISIIQVNTYNNQLKGYGFYTCHKCSRIKIEKTNIEKYGHSSPLGSKSIMEKSKKTMIRKYGVDNISKDVYIRENRSESMKLNTSNYNRIIIDKYGYNVSKLDWVKEKKKITTLKNWGVENPSQNIEIFDKSQKSGKKIKIHESGIWYRGTYEKDFLDFCLVNNINVEKGLTIKFNYNNKNKYYHSDFYIPEKNLVIEIKSSYYYDKFKELNEAKKEETIKIGYSHLFIINKDYTQFIDIFKNY